jgi:hypothetical protein
MRFLHPITQDAPLNLQSLPEATPGSAPGKRPNEVKRPREVI